MIESGFINGDCMDYLKDYPDNYFDLCIADPPYGDGGGGFASGTRFGERFDRYKSGGWHGKQKYHLGNQTLCVRNQKEAQELREQAEHGRRNSQKNYCVGCSA